MNNEVKAGLSHGESHEKPVRIEAEYSDGTKQQFGSIAELIAANKEANENRD